MLTEIRIPLTAEQGMLIEKTAKAAGVTVDAVVEDAASYILKCLHVFPKATPVDDSERFIEAYFPEDRWREVQARMAAEHWSVAVQ